MRHFLISAITFISGYGMSEAGKLLLVSDQYSLINNGGQTNPSFLQRYAARKERVS